MSESATFIVGDIIKHRPSGRVGYAGFVFNGAEVRVGDRFRLRYELSPTLGGEAKPSAINVTEISLLIQEINFMRTGVEGVTKGVTAAIFLEGDGTDGIRVGTCLSTAVSMDELVNFAGDQIDC